MVDSELVAWQSIIIALMLAGGFGLAFYRLLTQPWPTYPVLVKLYPQSIPLLAFRIAALVLFLAVLFLRIYQSNWFDLVYYTYWNFTLQTIYWIAAIYNQVIEWKSDEALLPLNSKSNAVRTANRFLNTLFDIVFASCILVACVYWFVLYNPSTPLVWTTIVVHGVNLVLFFIEFAFNEHLVQRHHMKFVVMWPALYGAVTWLGNATYLNGFWPYTLLDVSLPWAPLKWLGITLGHAFAFGVVLLLSNLKLRYAASYTQIHH